MYNYLKYTYKYPPAIFFLIPLFIPIIFGVIINLPSDFLKFKHKFNWNKFLAKGIIPLLFALPVASLVNIYMLITGVSSADLGIFNAIIHDRANLGTFIQASAGVWFGIVISDCLIVDKS